MKQGYIYGQDLAMHEVEGSLEGPGSNTSLRNSQRLNNTRETIQSILTADHTLKSFQGRPHPANEYEAHALQKSDEHLVDHEGAPPIMFLDRALASPEQREQLGQASQGNQAVR
jgi:hypothetical protein